MLGQSAQVGKGGGSHQGSVDGSRHGGIDPALDYTFNMHSGKGGGDDGENGAPGYPARNDSTGSFLDDYPGDSPYGSVGGSLVWTPIDIKDQSVPSDQVHFKISEGYPSVLWSILPRLRL